VNQDLIDREFGRFSCAGQRLETEGNLNILNQDLVDDEFLVITSIIG
jgi:hypothetical protein